MPYILWLSLFFTLSCRNPLSYRNQSIDFFCKSMDWFLYDNGLPHERVNDLSDILYMSNKLFQFVNAF